MGIGRCRLAAGYSGHPWRKAFRGDAVGPALNVKRLRAISDLMIAFGWSSTEGFWSVSANTAQCIHPLGRRSDWRARGYHSLSSVWLHDCYVTCSSVQNCWIRRRLPWSCQPPGTLHLRAVALNGQPSSQHASCRADSVNSRHPRSLLLWRCGSGRSAFADILPLHCLFLFWCLPFGRIWSLCSSIWKVIPENPVRTGRQRCRLTALQHDAFH